MTLRQIRYSAAHDQQQGGDLAQGAADVAQEHIRHAVLAGEAGHVAGLHIGQGRGGGDHVGSAADQGHPAGLGIRPGAAHGAGIAGHQGGTARQRGVDEVLADAAEQLLDHHDGEEVAHQDHPVGHVSPGTQTPAGCR